MKVLVLGSGVIGTSTAYELSQSGVEVTVVDRQLAAAMETSFANAGQVSPGYSTPWAAPGIPKKAIKWLLQKHAPLAVRLDGSLYQLQWVLQMLSNCNARDYAINKERMMRLAEYSRDRLRLLRAATGIAYDERSQGTLQVFRTAAQLESASRDIAVLKDCGVPFELMTTREQILRVEPGLQASVSGLTGAMYLPGDETGDCHRFTQALASRAAAQGVRFEYGQGIAALEQQGGAISGVRLSDGRLLQADRYVLALGSYSRPMALSLGLKLPVYPVKGYSLTLPITPGAALPESTVLDESYKVAVTRLGDRVRVGGMAELGGFDLRLREARRHTLSWVVQNLFKGTDTSQAQFWTGLRPMTPDGTPIVGGTRYSNLFLNTGHGTLGWTMACGSARVLADAVLGRTPEIRADDLALSRYA